MMPIQGLTVKTALVSPHAAWCQAVPSSSILPLKFAGLQLPVYASGESDSKAQLQISVLITIRNLTDVIIFWLRGKAQI